MGPWPVRYNRRRARGTRRRLLSIIKLLGEAHHRSGEARLLVPPMHLAGTDKDKRGTGDGILPEIGKKASPTINPENLIVGMPVKTKPIGSAGNRMLEPSDEELLARRHLRTVICERVDWHISRRNHGRQYRVYLPELSAKLSWRKLVLGPDRRTS